MPNGDTTMKRTLYCSLLASAAAASFASYAIEGATPIGAAFTIAQPGRYVVTSDITYASTVITINADRVELDLDGHVLTSTSTSLPVIKVQSQSHVRIHSGVLRGGREGVNARGSSNTHLDGLQIIDPAGNGIEFWDSSGISVRNCVARDAGAAGIEIDSALALSTGALIDNLITTPGTDGIYSHNSIGLSLSGNTIQNAGAAGMSFDSSAFNLLRGNLIETAAREGVRLGISALMRVSANVIRTTTFDGLVVTNTSDDGAVDRNVISGCVRDGIDNNGSQLTFRGNLLEANGHLGLRLGSGGPNNVYRGNFARGSAAGGPACLGAVSTNDFCDEALGNNSQGDNYLPTQR
jgi:parallel beta-helix repeat protein